MSKNTIKKIILTIIILTVLILSLIFFYRITSEDYKKDISIVKKIINEKYEDVKYFDNSYLYAYNDNEYTIFDYNGNKLYVINNKKDIVSVSKKYYISRDNNYHLYNINSEELASGNNIYGINDYLIFVDNNIVDTKGEVLFYNVKSIEKYYKNKYFVIDNYFINEKGKVLLYDYKVVKEKVIDNEIDYFIVKKDDRYYSFFPLVNSVVGDGFDKYFEYNDKIYIVANNKIYMIYTNGLRKEIKFNVNKNIYSLDYSNAVRKNRVLTIRDYYLGILETDTNKFYKITKTRNYTYKYIDSSHINVSCNDKNYVYDLDNYKVDYISNFDNIILFKNKYKTIKKNNMYYLMDDKGQVLNFSDKQIIILDSKIKAGKPDKNIVIFDNNYLYEGQSFIINNKTYYKYEKNNIKYIISSDLKEKYKSKSYLNYMDDTIVELDNNKLYFYNLKTDREYIYDIKNYKIQNDEINKNEIILSDGNNIIILNKKGKMIKKIRNTKIKEIKYNKIREAIIITVENNNKKMGAYVLK